MSGDPNKDFIEKKNNNVIQRTTTETIRLAEPLPSNYLYMQQPENVQTQYVQSTAGYAAPMSYQNPAQQNQGTVQYSQQGLPIQQTVTSFPAGNEQFIQRQDAAVFQTGTGEQFQSNVGQMQQVRQTADNVTNQIYDARYSQAPTIVASNPQQYPVDSNRQYIINQNYNQRMANPQQTPQSNVLNQQNVAYQSVQAIQEETVNPQYVGQQIQPNYVQHYQQECPPQQQYSIVYQPVEPVVRPHVAVSPKTQTTAPTQSPVMNTATLELPEYSSYSSSQQGTVQLSPVLQQGQSTPIDQTSHQGGRRQVGGSFQITSVCVHRSEADDSADDLDTDEISRMTDNETPSYSEDSRDIDHPYVTPIGSTMQYSTPIAVQKPVAVQSSQIFSPPQGIIHPLQASTPLQGSPYVPSASPTQSPIYYATFSIPASAIQQNLTGVIQSSHTQTDSLKKVHVQSQAGVVSPPPPPPPQIQYPQGQKINVVPVRPATSVPVQTNQVYYQQTIQDVPRPQDQSTRSISIQSSQMQVRPKTSPVQGETYRQIQPTNIQYVPLTQIYPGGDNVARPFTKVTIAVSTPLASTAQQQKLSESAPVKLQASTDSIKSAPSQNVSQTQMVHDIHPTVSSQSATPERLQSHTEVQTPEKYKTAASTQTQACAQTQTEQYKKAAPASVPTAIAPASMPTVAAPASVPTAIAPASMPTVAAPASMPTATAPAQVVQYQTSAQTSTGSSQYSDAVQTPSQSPTTQTQTYAADAASLSITNVEYVDNSSQNRGRWTCMDYEDKNKQVQLIQKMEEFVDTSASGDSQAVDGRAVVTKTQEITVTNVNKGTQEVATVESTSKEAGDAELMTSDCSANIDIKIEKAMDLVKNHLMCAVRQDVEVLKSKITELLTRISQLETENVYLRSAASPEVLQSLERSRRPALPTPPEDKESTSQPPKTQ